MNETLSSISDTLQANHTSLLDALSSGDGSGNGSGQTDDDTETNAKLDTISNQLGTLVDTFAQGENNADPLTESDIQAETDKIALPDYQAAADEGLEKINEAIGKSDSDFKKIEDLSGSFGKFESLSQFFANAPDNCSPINLGNHSLDVCPMAPEIRSVLTYIFYMLTILFLIRSTHQTIQNMRF